MSTRQITGLIVAAMWTAGGVASGAPIAWVALGGLLAICAVASMTPPVEHGDDEQALRRQLAVARRRGEEVDVVCATASGVRVGDVRDAMRISDFVTVREGRAPGDLDIRAVLDTDRLDRAAFETRMRKTLGGGWGFSWARFPEDGATFDALVLRAGTRARAALTTSDHGET